VVFGPRRPVSAISRPRSIMCPGRPPVGDVFALPV